MDIKEAFENVDAHIKNLCKEINKHKAWYLSLEADSVEGKFKTTKKQIKFLESEISKLKKAEEKEKQKQEKKAQRGVNK